MSDENSFLPFVTIGIPTFNRASWLKKCVVAALSQTYPHFEVVVSDNASTDETAEVLSQFRDLRLRVIRQQTNIGILPNWNACLAEARGEYFVYCSDDDALAPWILEKCVSVAARDPQMPIVMGLCDFYLATEGFVDRATPSTRLSTGIWQGTRLLIEYLRNEITVGNCSMMIRTEALRARGGLPTDVPSWGADVAGWAPLLMRGKAGFVNEACATYCVHNASESSTLTFDGRLQGERELTNCIVRMADGIIEEAGERRRVQREAKLFLARRAVFTLAQHRSGVIG